MIHYQPTEVEDKTCRLCGYADQSNLNLFRAKDIYKKVLTLYPLVLYHSDPLPKNICVKCYGSAIHKYEEYQRILKIQNKWINNVRKNQPSNPYIQMLDLMEETNKTIKEKLRNLSNDDICESFQLLRFPTDVGEIINTSQLLSSASSPDIENFNIVPKYNQLSQIAPVNNSTTRTLHYNNSLKITKEKTQIPQTEQSSSFAQQNSSTNTADNIERLQSMLASNGCTLLSITTERSSSKNTAKRSTPFQFPKNKCRFCFKLFPNEKFLSVHLANTHLKISTHKIFEKKLLKKRERRAIEIMLHNKIWLRCQNCLNIYGNRESIVNHWKNKRCEFFCKICGNEFPTNPKLLRQHLLNKHELTYTTFKNLKRNVIQLKTLEKYRSSAVEVPSVKNESTNEILIENECTTDETRIEPTIEPAPRRIPVLKLTRKANTTGDEFDIKLEIDEPTILNNDLKSTVPILRVKDLSELQEQVTPPNIFNNLNLNTLSFDSNLNNITNNSSDFV